MSSMNQSAGFTFFCHLFDQIYTRGRWFCIANSSVVLAPADTWSRSAHLEPRPQQKCGTHSYSTSPTACAGCTRAIALTSRRVVHGVSISHLRWKLNMRRKSAHLEIRSTLSPGKYAPADRWSMRKSSIQYKAYLWGAGRLSALGLGLM